MSFNPNDPGTADSNIFGLPYTTAEADLILLPIPWEATVSYGTGTALAPDAILAASKQIDLYHPLLHEVWTRRMAMDEIPLDLLLKSNEVRIDAQEVIARITAGETIDPLLHDSVNLATQQMIAHVEQQAEKWLAQGKAIGGVGGDHSTPLGIFKALAKKQSYGILQIDAHCDLRWAFEGFTYSHASIMYNALEEIPAISSLTQVGIRDYCAEEVDYIANSKGRVKTFYDRDMQYDKLRGTNWHSICERIIKTLPENVFISFDIDGLTPDHCPGTGTPVPGGLLYAEAAYLIELVAQRKRIVGFDLNEVGPHDGSDWDANVGARVLFLLCCAYWISKERTN